MRNILQSLKDFPNFLHFCAFDKCSLSSKIKNEQLPGWTLKDFYDVVFQYEQEIERLDQQLQDSQHELKRAMERIKSHENNTEVLVTDWERRLEETEERMRRQQQEKDEQMKNIIQR